MSSCRLSCLVCYHAHVKPPGSDHNFNAGVTPEGLEPDAFSVGLTGFELAMGRSIFSQFRGQVAPQASMHEYHDFIAKSLCERKS